MNFNFSNLKAVSKANTKVGTPRGQNFDVRFRRATTKKGGLEEARIDTKFHISDKVWDALDLENKGAMQFVAPSGEVLFITCPNEDAVLLKRTNKLEEGGSKGRNFKAEILEKDLISAGVLKAEVLGNQFLKFEPTSVEGLPEGYTAFVIAVDTTDRTKEEVEEAEAQNTELPTSPGTSVADEDNF